MTNGAEIAHLPEPVRRYLTRSLKPGGTVPHLVRVRQSGEMWRKPAGRRMRFSAVEEFVVNRVAFSWRARFPIAGPLALTVVDGLSRGSGRLRVSLLGIPVQTQTGAETDIGEAMRYLAELAWAPHAIAANPELEWQGVDDRTVEVACHVGAARAQVRWELDEAGDLTRATGVRPFQAGKNFVPRRWGGDYRDYAEVDGTRVPTLGEAWWELPEGRFVYWRGRITGLELEGA